MCLFCFSFSFSMKVNAGYYICYFTQPLAHVITCGPYARSHFCRCTLWAGLHAQVCARECVQKCMFTRVSRVCERAFIVFKHCLVAVSVTDLSMSVCSEALSGTVHTVYTQTGCAGKKKYFHTLDNGGTDTMRTTYGYI